jgi:hypothetical protein
MRLARCRCVGGRSFRRWRWCFRFFSHIAP